MLATNSHRSNVVLFVYLKSTTEGPKGHVNCWIYTKKNIKYVQYREVQRDKKDIKCKEIIHMQHTVHI